MTISLRAAGAVSSNTASPNPSYPAGVQANDMNVLTVIAKPTGGTTPDEVIITTPAGWKRIFDGRDGNVAPFNPPGTGGSVRIAIYLRTGSAFTGSIGTIGITNCSVAAAVINTYAGSAGTGWSTATTYGYDISGTSYDSNLTIASTNQFLTTNDWLLSLTATDGNAGIGTASLTAAGATLGAVVSRQAVGSSVASPSAQLGLDVRDVPVTAGTSTGGPRLTGTTNLNGISVFVRLHEGTSAVSSSDTSASMEKSTLGAITDIPTVKEWASGDDLSAENLNTYFRDPIAWVLSESPRVQLEATVATTFNASTHTIVWDKIRSRRGSIFINGTKVSVPVTGHYIGQYSVGVRDNGTMGFPFVMTVEILTYPGGTGTANVHNVSTNYTTMAVEESFGVGSQPYSLYLNAGDAIEVRMSGAWNTAGGAQLWVGGDAGAVNGAWATMLDLHWFSTWDGVSR